MFTTNLVAQGPWVNVWLRSKARHGDEPDENQQGDDVQLIGEPVPTSTTVLLAGLSFHQG